MGDHFGLRADASMVPESLRHLGEDIGYSDIPHLTDAQGNSIASRGMKRYEFLLQDTNGQQYLIRERCVVGPVRCPLLAVGKLLRKGWQITSGGGPGQLHLEEPFGRKTQIGYRNHSLMVRGHIRALTEIPRTLPPRVPAVELPENMQELIGTEGMHTLDNGWRMHYSPAATQLLDGREWFDGDYWCCRTTFLQTSNGRWLQVENSADYTYEANPYGTVSINPVARVTLFSMTPFTSVSFPGGLDPKASDRVMYEPSPADEPEVGRSMEPSQPSQPHRLADSSLSEAPAAGHGVEREAEDEEMGAPPAGLTQEELEAYVGTWAAKAVEDDMVREPAGLRQPDEPPDDEAQARHRLTHVPFAAWCPSCVKTRSRDDHHRRAQNDHSIPVVQVDFYYTKVDPESRPNPDGYQEATNMIAVDLETKMVLSVPGPDKGPSMLRRAAEELTRFTVSLHNEDAVVIQSDGEPSIKAVVRATAAARQRLNKKTLQRTTPVAGHSSNGGAERAIQTVRRLGNCFMEAFEERAGKLSVGSHLRVWVQGHAAFIYNRFHLLPGINKTPFEIAHGGKHYDQRLCEFGETVFGRVVRKYKGEAQWIKGVWCGINSHNGAHRIMSAVGHLECNAVRRGASHLQMKAEEVDGEMFGLPWEHGVVEKKRQAKRRPHPTAVPAVIVSENPAGLVAPLTPATPGGRSQALATPALPGVEPSTPRPPAQVPDNMQDEAGTDPESSSSSSSTSEDELLAVADASPTGVKRKASGLGAERERTRGRANDDARQPGTKRKSSRSPEKEELEPSQEIRLVETVDADWHEAVNFEVPEADNGDDPWELIGESEPREPAAGNDGTAKVSDFPPELATEEIERLDDEAELAEVERLERIGVLQEVTNEPAEHLSTIFVKVWKQGPAGWFRRARLVARQYKWASHMQEDETFAPASVAPLGRMVPLLAMTWGTPIYVLDIKDAYLTVDQPADEPVTISSPLSWFRKHGEHKTWKLGKVLPGQRRGAQEWYNKFNEDLTRNALEPMIEVPTLYRSLEGRFGGQLHVDDMMSTGDVEVIQPLHTELGRKYTVKIAGPYKDPGDEFEFLKRRYRIEADRSITVRPAIRFYYDVWELTGKPRTRTTPGPADLMFHKDDSEELPPEGATNYRTVVGKLLYISSERPDAQVVIQYLASKASSPTKNAQQVLRHLCGYLWATQGHGINLRVRAGSSILRAEGAQPDDASARDQHGKHIVEAVSDSNFANNQETRRSLSSGHIYYDGALVYSFVRAQKVVTTSSGEAELVALTQTVGEAVLVRKAVAFLLGLRSEGVDLTARTDSSVARAIASRNGIGRVKHLSTSCLWLQGWVARKELKISAIPTEINPADLGTKVLTARRMALLMFIMGMVVDNGNRIGEEEHRQRRDRRAGPSQAVVRLAQMVLAMQLQGCTVGENGEAGAGECLDHFLVKLLVALEVSNDVLVAWPIPGRSS